MKEGDEGWLDFKAIKEKSDARAVLSHFGLLEHLEERGAELSGWCPFGEEHGKKDSFSMNVEKKTFQCFACKARGSLLDFVAKFRNIDLREAAQCVASMGGGTVGEKKSDGRPYGKSKGEGVACENVAEASADIPAVMSFSLASRLIIANAINPAHLLVVNMDAVGIEWQKAKKE